jgi:hypothetical protein
VDEGTRLRNGDCTTTVSRLSLWDGMDGADAL